MMSFYAERRGWRLALSAAVFLLVVSRASSQDASTKNAATMQSAEPKAGGAEFDVVSIKLNKSGSGHAHMHTSSENADLSTENVLVKELLAYAYDVSESRIVGLAGAMGSARFDVVAKAGSAVNETVKTMEPRALDKLTQEMMRAMLAERFKVVHREKRELPVYAMEVAKGGVKLEASDVKGTHVTGRRGSLVADGIDMSQLADELTGDVGRVVVDKTAVAGRYKLALRWTPEDGPAASSSGGDENAAPSIFTAVQEQLGLKLEAQKAMVDVLVVDRAEMPGEN